MLTIHKINYFSALTLALISIWPQPLSKILPGLLPHLQQYYYYYTCYLYLHSNKYCFHLLKITYRQAAGARFLPSWSATAVTMVTTAMCVHAPKEGGFVLLFCSNMNLFSTSRGQEWMNLVKEYPPVCTRFTSAHKQPRARSLSTSTANVSTSRGYLSARTKFWEAILQNLNVKSINNALKLI